MGKKDKKGGKNAAEKAAKKEEKKNKQMEKAKKKKLKENGIDEEEDVEEILKQLDKQDAEKEAARATVTVTQCQQPSPRVYCSMTVIPSGEVVVFGGEYFDGQKVQVYNQLFRWNLEKDEWKRIECPLSPKPRSSHQAVCYKDQLLVFGGEFATVAQFHHFRDVWSLDLKTNRWTGLECSGQIPIARSGHRMVVWRNFLIVFGGFHDTVRETKYFNDVHALSLQSLKWQKIDFPAHAHAPAARSACLLMLALGSDTLFVSGGYSKVKDTARNAQGKTHTDCWALNLKPLATGQTRLQWEKQPQKGQPPSIRSGMSVVMHKGLGVVFGGVYDEDDGGLGMRSVFYNDLHAFDTERRRWYCLQLRKKKGGGKGGKKRRGKKGKGAGAEAAGGGGKEGEGEEDWTDEGEGSSSEDEEENEKQREREERDAILEQGEEDDDDVTFGYIDQNGRLVRIRIDDADLPPDLDAAVKQAEEGGEGGKGDEGDQKEEGTEGKKEETTEPSSSAVKEGDSSANKEAETEEEEEEKEEPKAELKIEEDTPLPRINPQLLVRGNQLMVYGGLVEFGPREVTLDDCWSLDLNKREKWECLVKGSFEDQAWFEEEEEEGEGSSDEDDSDEDDDSEEDEDEDEEEGGGGKKRMEGVRERMTALKQKHAVDDPATTPQLGETMRAFFERTRGHWTEQVHQNVAQQAAAAGGSGPSGRMDAKELRREAFALAEERFDQLRPLLDELASLEERQAALERKEQKKTAAAGASSSSSSSRANR
uniref:DUF4110 domain-containing protein n=1 Tax=Chromera velia CCMP2878 TaxID=1169474 RepID=A0A0G4HTA0_9ALVE|eukprot:Cvel_8421.t1-p1 / transcript=Cvel_8421.t1 / gene=Cvel_8421 / organism=Chromera_velia_CCMP2878 / gene_product=Kelch domain-containing protein 4, putative / transcript_product=Kelch domain-containing protein 4, putative / location=Cvel_scaffold465:17816-22576(-) / protein_length=762 / sequence_SO=supercontig / SO=protein_coding / is_pseudo=false